MPTKEVTSIRLSKVARELNIALPTIVDFLTLKGYEVESNPNAKIDGELYDLLQKEFQSDKSKKEEAEQLRKETHELREKEETIVAPTAEKRKKADQEEVLIVTHGASAEIETEKPVKKTTKKVKVEPAKEEPETIKATTAKGKGVTVVDKIDLEQFDSKTKKKKAAEEKAKKEAEAAVPEVKAEEITPEPEVVTPAVELPPEIQLIKAEAEKLAGVKLIGKIVLPEKRKPKPVASSNESEADKLSKRRKRKRTERKPGEADTAAKRDTRQQRPAGRKEAPKSKEEPTQKEIQDKIKDTLARLTPSRKSKGSTRRRERREDKEMAEAEAKERLQDKVIKVTEFVTVSELSKLMDVNVNQIIAACLDLGRMVSINQRLDAEMLTVVAEEFGFKVEFVSADVQDSIIEEEDKPEDLVSRPPIVTVMGHVDHGKTSLLDYVRKANVIAGEAGGITQHIGAYEVTMENGKHITFLDTPGHEAFTAMRARGAKVTDVAIIVVAADDSVMPQTVEAINHAQAAEVPIVIAINKMDKPDANSEKIKEQLANMNILVEDWGGKFQCQEISAKQGLNIDKLLEKVLLEAELLELTANPNKNAVGTIIEATLDKGRGYVATMLVSAGTLRGGDILIAGCHSGRVKAMFNERGTRIEEAGPSAPVMVLGLSGAPQAGDKFNVMSDEREARDIANKRLQLQREQGIRTHKHITLEEIGRRIAIGNFKELNVIVKGDVDGSVEALADSILKLSNEEIQLNVIHKSVGQITESDVLLASASDALIIGFQVRPSINARKLAENEQIDVRLYSIIYDAINELKDAMQGMLAPEYEEKIVCNVEIRDVFKIPKVGTIAGCMVLDGKVTRNTKIRVVRDGIVVYTGELASLKRFKDDVKEVANGYECGLNIANFNDIKVGDIVEGYTKVEVKRTLNA